MTIGSRPAAHLALAVPLDILAVGWDWPGPDSWFRQLNFYTEGSAAAQPLVLHLQCRCYIGRICGWRARSRVALGSHA